MIRIKRLRPDMLEDYLDFFDHRAFSDGSPFYPCYCSAFNMSRERIQNEFFRQAEINGGGSEGWQKALRDAAVRMVTNGEIQGYLAYDNDLAVGWCNANDRQNYCRVGEFDLSSVPPDEPCDDCQCRGQVKSVVCFEIAPEYRGKGIATLLLEAVCRDALADGYAYVEAYPVKDGGLQGLAFTGPKRLYEKAGFVITGRKGSTLVMRKACHDIQREHAMIEFRKFSEFPRGTMYDILQDAYSYDARNKQIWDTNWKESDDFFYDHPDIADKYGLVSCLDGKPIGFVTWDPRNRPDYVEIGHNGIREQYKGRGYGRMQLEEAIRRIRTYEGLKRIIVCTNSNLIAPKNYESVGFVLYNRKPNETESAVTGDYLWYEMIL